MGQIHTENIFTLVWNVTQEEVQQLEKHYMIQAVLTIITINIHKQTELFSY